jgi:hypothetical protein
MAILVINTGRVPLQVGIILKNGTKTTSRIMHRSRANLAEGSKVDPNWLALYGKAVKVVEVKKPIAVAAVVSSNTEAQEQTSAPTEQTPVEPEKNTAETVTSTAGDTK